jgi:predicted ester cyclase
VSDQAAIEVYQRFIHEGASVSNAAVMEAILEPGIDLPTVGEGGVAALLAVHKGMRAGFPDMRASIDEIAESGEWVAARLTWTGTHTGEFAGIAATGRSVSVREFETVRVRDGRVVELRSVFDIASLIAQVKA